MWAPSGAMVALGDAQGRLQFIAPDGALLSTTSAFPDATAVDILSPKLTTLDLRGCTHISYASISSILHGCPMLTTVHLDYSHAVSDEEVSFLTAEYHAVNILFYVEKQQSMSCMSDDGFCDPFSNSCDAFDTF